VEAEKAECGEFAFSRGASAESLPSSKTLISNYDSHMISMHIYTIDNDQMRP
jgi:hypothetical protein